MRTGATVTLPIEAVGQPQSTKASVGDLDRYNAVTTPSNGMYFFVNPATAPAKAIVKICIIATLALLVSLAFGQDPSISGIPVGTDVTVEQLESVITAIEAREGLEAKTRGQAIEQLRDAQAQIQNRKAAEAAAAAYAATLDTASAETESLRKELEESQPGTLTTESLGINDSATLSELDQRLAQETAELSAADSMLAELELQVEAEGRRPAAARERISQLRSSREALSAAINTPSAPGEPQVLADGRKLAAQMRRAAQGAEINMLEQELLSHAVRQDLLKAQRDATARSQLEASRRVELLREAVNTRRQAAAMFAQQAALAAELAAADKHPVVRTLAEGNANLTRRLPKLAADIERETTRLELTEAQVRDLEQRLARSQQRLEIGGLSRAIGLLLLEERRSLPQVSQERAQIRIRRKELAEIGLAQIQIQEQRRELTPLDSRVESLMQEVSVDVDDPAELAEIRGEVRLLLRDRRDLLLQAESDYRSYLQTLGDLDVAQRRLLGSAADYRNFLTQNLLWIPSAPVVFTGEWRDIGPAAAWALSPDAWLKVGAELAVALREDVVAVTVYLLLLLLLVAIHRPLLRKQRAMDALVGRLSTDNIGLTLASLAISALRVLPVPLLFFGAAWFLDNGTALSAFSGGVAVSLFATAPFLYNVLLFRALCGRSGVLKVHFGWDPNTLAAIRRQLDRLATIAAPILFATAMLYQSDSSDDRATLGRLLFLILMVVLSLSFHALAHPLSGVAAAHYARQSKTWVSRLRWLWYALAIGSPLLLAAISFLGYLYTSTILAGLLVNTIWLALALIVVNLIVLRWLALERRKLALQMALKERQAQKAERAKEGAREDEADAPQQASTPVDLDEVDQQTRKLLRSALTLVAVLVGWGIWAEVLPALTILDQVGLWTQTVTVQGVESIVPVTLADLLFALLVVAVTAITSKNLPGLMEIAILQHITLAPGSRYAINTLVRYVVVTVGIVWVLNIIGWNWSQIQWLVAALSVGLGFGLQEIVANFVSGLVILFERPVRVGDTITVGQLTGTVSRVRIRATTITDWDRKEIIVPNKAFITEQVVNWTLSDPITRMVIPVGISYGSDVELAHRLMSDTLAALPLVMEEPPPKVFFTGFGESSLDFTIHVYLRQLSDRLPLTHQVHDAVLKALRQNGIEIPFPQRDLHIRSTVDVKSE